MTDMTRAERLDALRPEVLACQSCGLRRTARQVVFGEGHPDARVVFIGEGPGAQEDAAGRPFVGAAGQLLDKMLAAMNLSRSRDVYILNVVKCRPPGNRAPEKEEQEQCRPHLDRQVAILDPVIVVLLGSTAVRALIQDDARITRVRGKWVSRDGRWWMPTYHPAALLRNPELKRLVWSDLKRVLDKYRELVDPGHQTPHYPIRQ